jgi:hypothetical protein
MTMRRMLALPLLALAIPAQAAEKRCGYLENPTPANWWFTDAAGEWTISVQGGYQADGIDTIPESFFGKGWVATNGSYGYRCGCITVDSDRKSMRIKRIYSGQGLPMKQCKADPKLRKPPTP